ncbi:hypothetical protein [Streptomyces sp. NPDC059783]|uniref:hypothetical protein n=1 Tax=Streptomyces sp. NPDC059783 TaxID=3346944 RepID=UPI00364B79D7
MNPNQLAHESPNVRDLTRPHSTPPLPHIFAMWTGDFVDAELLHGVVTAQLVPEE